MAANRFDIPIGRKNAISRKQLGGIWKMRDRSVREAIANLRATAGDDGYAILSTSHTPSGYWRSNDPEEIRAFIRETEARGRSTFLALRDAKRVLSAQRDAAHYPVKLLDEGA